METIDTIALMLGVAWASGINLYAAIFVLGYMGATGNATLPPDLQLLSDPMVMGAAGVMYCVEFFADKTPGVDTAWDGIHTFIRIPAGAILAAGVANGIDISPAAELAAAILGGTLAATSHMTKAGSRVLINTSPEPFSNWTASIVEDLAVIGALWAALNQPWLFFALLLLFIVAAAWALPRIWRVLKKVAHRIGTFFAARPVGEERSALNRADILQTLYSDAQEKPKQSD